MAVALGFVAASELVGQGGRPLSVQGVRPLAFGLILPGVPEVVLRTDPVKSGRFDLSGERFAQVELTFTLPGQMIGPGGATMPLLFGSGDAGYSETQAIASQVAFDPNQRFVATLSRNGKGAVFLGGTVTPGAGQRAGSYTATITLTVAYLP